MINEDLVSVVIATLGGEFLKCTLEHLNSSNLRPHEILICIPELEASKLDLTLADNVRIVITPKRGQVSQRAHGLGLVKCEFVMQIDDDVFLKPDAIGLLINAIKNTGRCSAVAPLFKDCSTGDYVTRYRNNLKGVSKNLIATVIGGAPWGKRRMGRIDKAGIPYFIDHAFCNLNRLISVEWVPGGCVLTRRVDLIDVDYFPFEGKAFSEDVIHSLLWRQRGVRLFVEPNVSVCTHISHAALNTNGIRADFEARKHVVSLMSGSLWRCRLWYCWCRLRLIIQSIYKI